MDRAQKLNSSSAEPGVGIRERYRALFETSTDGIMIVDDQGRYVEVNESLCRLLRAPRERLVGAHFSEFIPSGRIEDAIEAFSSLQRGNHVVAMEFPLQAADGTMVELEWSSRAAFVDGLHVCVGRDIAARKQAEKALRLSEARLARAQRIAGLGVWEIDSSTGAVYWSNEMYRLFGVEPGSVEPTIEAFYAAVPDEDRDRIRQSAEQALRDGTSYDLVHRLRRADGSLRYVREHAEIVADPDGGGPHFLGTMHDVTDRMEAETELAAVNARLAQRVAELQALMDILPIGVAIAHDPQCRYVTINSPFASMLGLEGFDNISKSGPHPELLPYTILRDGSEVDPSTLPMQVAAATGKKVPRQECDVRLADGSLLHLLIGAAPLLDEDGRIKGSIGVHTDITALKLVEEHLQRSEERYRTFIEHSTEGIYRFEAERPIALDQPEDELIAEFYALGYLAECNDALARMYGFSDATDLIGARLGDFLPASDPHNLEYLRSYIRSGFRLSDAESHEIDRDGNPKYFLNNLVGILEDGRMVRAWGTQRDVTDRKRAEDELRASEQRFALFMRHLPGLAWIKDIEGRYLFATDAATKAFGTTRQKLYARTDADIFPPETAAQFQENDRRAVALGGVQTIETLEQEDGVHHSVVSKFPILGADGQPVMIGGVAIDISERLRAEEALRQADRRKDEFLAMLAHELRNPLSSIGNAVQLLERAESDAEQLEWSKQVIGRQVKHLTNLIDDLLDVSRITRGKVELKKQVVDAATAVASALETVRPVIDARGHQIEVGLGSNLRLEADPTRLEQILVNLLSNAAKYTPGGGTIRIDARHDGSEIVFRVLDNGIGIRPESVATMFELFAQGDRTLARSEGGLGIGLTLVRSLAELHGGSVVARSDGPGTGSEFTVRLPVGEPAAPVPASEAPRPRPKGRGSRILVVDDSVDNARGLARLLKVLGHEVRVEHAGPEAIAAALADRPDFLLLDIGLPGMDGYEVATKLRGEDSLGSLVIIAISGYGQDEDRRRSKEAGIDHHLVKPIDHDELIGLLAKDP